MSKYIVQSKGTPAQERKPGTRALRSSEWWQIIDLNSDVPEVVCECVSKEKADTLCELLNSDKIAEYKSKLEQLIENGTARL